MTNGQDETTTENLPYWPRLIADSAIRQRPLGQDNQESYLRRILAAAINSGVDTGYLSKVNIPLNASSSLSPRNFSRIQLNWHDPNPASEEDFREILENFEDHIDSSVNEATLSSLFWNLLIASCLRPFRNLGFKISVDWSVKNLLPCHGDRRIDLVARVVLPGGELNGRRFDACSVPVLLVESGKDSMCIGSEHKDTSKLRGAMAAVCTRFGFELHKRGIEPEKARVFGLLIGGSSAQVCVAHPEAIPVPGGRFQLQANVTSSQHWLIDIHNHPSPAADDCSFCCQCSSDAPFVQLHEVTEADTIASQVIPAPIEDESSSLDLEAVEDVQFITKAVEEVQFITEAVEEVQFIMTSQLCQGPVQVSALIHFNTVIKGIVSAIEAIFDEGPTGSDNRPFLPPKDSDLIVKGRRSESITTPPNLMFTSELLNANSAAVALVTIESAMFVQQFALHWPFCLPLYFLFTAARSNSPVSVFRASKFLIDILAAMLAIHREGLSFAGDLYTHHIGYSAIDATWKPGTFYLKPLTAEFAAEDVLRLGELLFDELYPALHNDVFMIEYTRFEIPEELLQATKKAFLRLEQLMASMKERNHAKRISVLDALRLAHQSLKEFNDVQCCLPC